MRGALAITTTSKSFPSPAAKAKGQRLGVQEEGLEEPEALQMLAMRLSGSSKRKTRETARKVASKALKLRADASAYASLGHTLAKVEGPIPENRLHAATPPPSTTNPASIRSSTPPPSQHFSPL